MHSPEKILEVYLDLADLYLRQDDAGMREVFLVLAADAALKAGQPARAEQSRQELLRDNPYHLLRPFATFAEAGRHPDIENYLDDLRHKYPSEVAEDMLELALPHTLPPPAPNLPATMPPRGFDRGPRTPPPSPRQPPVPRHTDEQAEPLRVYPPEPDVAETQPPPPLSPQQLPPQRQAPPRQPPPPPTRPVPPARGRPAAPPPTVPAARARPPAPPRPIPVPPPRATRPGQSEPTPDEERLKPGAWVGTLLFLIVLVAGLALLAFTLVPQELIQEVFQGS